MDTFHNLDLLALGVVVALTGVLGYSAFASDPRSRTNQMFFFFSVITAAWGVVNYLSYQFSDPLTTLWLLRGIMFFATLQAFSLYALFRAFPDDARPFQKWEIFGLMPLTAFTALLALTPALFSGVEGVSRAGEVAQVQKGPGIALFGILAVGLVVSAVFFLVRKTIGAPRETRKAFDVVLAGVAITFTLIIAFNFVLAALLQDPSYIPYGAVFMFPLVAAISYAIQKHRVFNIKAAASALLVCVLAVVSFLEIIFSNDLSETIFRSGTFALIIIAGTSLVRGVVREIAQRELIEKQEKELEEVNRQQESLLHFISHEIKGYLAKSEAAFAAIFGGDYGQVSPELREMSGTALADVRKGVSTVMDILDASNLKKGTVSFKSEQFDILKSIDAVVAVLKPSAEEKGLELVYERPVSGRYEFAGDEEKLREHVFRNLIDNSIKYTPHGSVRIQLARTDAVYRIVVQDTGVGITEADKKRLFTEGGKGAESTKVNVHSTGYGLFIAKRIVEAHGGRVWAESDGKDQGSRFIVELPAARA